MGMDNHGVVGFWEMKHKLLPDTRRCIPHVDAVPVPLLAV